MAPRFEFLASPAGRFSLPCRVCSYSIKARLATSGFAPFATFIAVRKYVGFWGECGAKLF
jgi:hypothetical protein